MKSFSAAAHSLIDAMRFARRLEGILVGEDLEKKSIAQLNSNILFSEKNSEKDNEPSTDKVPDSTESVVVDTHVISVKVDDDDDDRDRDRDDDRDRDRDVPIIMDVLT